MSSLRVKIGLTAVLVGLAATAAPSQAGFSLVTSRAALGGADQLDWGTLGPTSTNVSNPFNITSTNGVTASVSEATGTFQRRDQGNGWAGNFAAGDRLLWTGGNNGPVTVAFSQLVNAAGAQFQTDFFGTFTGSVEALSAAGVVLASFNFNGTANNAGNNSAPFAGIVATGGDSFSRLRYTGVSGVNTPNSFALNQLDFTLAPTGPVSAVPVPPTAALALLGVASYGGGGLVRRRLWGAPAAV